jgi:hypothetical protein
MHRPTPNTSAAARAAVLVPLSIQAAAKAAQPAAGAASDQESPTITAPIEAAQNDQNPARSILVGTPSISRAPPPQPVVPWAYGIDAGMVSRSTNGFDRSLPKAPAGNGPSAPARPRNGTGWQSRSFVAAELPNDSMVNGAIAGLRGRRGFVTGPVGARQSIFIPTNSFSLGSSTCCSLWGSPQEGLPSACQEITFLQGMPWLGMKAISENFRIL